VPVLSEYIFLNEAEENVQILEATSGLKGMPGEEPSAADPTDKGPSMTEPIGCTSGLKEMSDKQPSRTEPTDERLSTGEGSSMTEPTGQEPSMPKDARMAAIQDYVRRRDGHVGGE
jgi:hypothetical protein